MIFQIVSIVCVNLRYDLNTYGNIINITADDVSKISSLVKFYIFTQAINSRVLKLHVTLFIKNNLDNTSLILKIFTGSLNAEVKH